MSESTKKVCDALLDLLRKQHVRGQAVKEFGDLLDDHIRAVVREEFGKRELQAEEPASEPTKARQRSRS